MTQYVLIALGMQRRMTWAFLAAVVFNVVANIIFIPAFSFRASAVISVLSKSSSSVPFALWIRGARPAPGAAARVAAPRRGGALRGRRLGVGWRAGLGSWAGAMIGAVYVHRTLALGTVGAEERAFVRRLIAPTPDPPPSEGRGSYDAVMSLARVTKVGSESPRGCRIR